MATIAEAVIKLELENKELKAKLGESVTQFEGFKGKMQQAGDFLKKNWLAITAVIAGVSVAIREVVSVVSDWVKEAMEAQRVESLLSSALSRQTKNYQQITREMKTYATQLAQTTRFGEEEYLEVMAKMVARGMDYNSVMKSMPALADLAIGGQMDLTTASRLLMVAYNGNTDALQRYQINVVKTGDKSKDFEATLSAVKRTMGNMAMQDATTLNGKLAIMNNNIGEVKETLGNELVPAIDKAVTSFNKWITDSSNVNALVDGILLIIKAIGWVVKTVVGVKSAFELWFNYVELQFDLLFNTIFTIGTIFADVFTGALNVVRDSFKAIRADLIGFLLNPFKTVSGVIANNFKVTFDKIKEDAKIGMSIAKDSVVSFADDTVNIIDSNNKLLQGIDSLTNVKRQENSNKTTEVIVANENKIRDLTEAEIKQWDTAMKVMSDSFENEFAKNVGASLKDLNLNFNNIFESIYRGFLSMLAQMAAQAAASAVFNAIFGESKESKVSGNKSFLSQLPVIGGFLGLLGLNKGGFVKGYAGGGTVSGPSGIDKVPAMLTEGEYVVNRTSAKAFGPLLESMNNYGRTRMALGGSVSNSSTRNVTINAPVSLQGGVYMGGITEAKVAKELGDMLKRKGIRL